MIRFLWYYTKPLGRLCNLGAAVSPLVPAYYVHSVVTQHDTTHVGCGIIGMTSCRDSNACLDDWSA